MYQVFATKRRGTNFCPFWSVILTCVFLTIFNTNYGINVITGLVFRTPDEFDAFVEFLDPEKVKQRLKEGKTSLFTQDAPVDKTLNMSASTDKILPTTQQQCVENNKGIKRINKGKIAREGQNRWKNAARKGSGIK